jgi:hypothetical protein
MYCGSDACSPSALRMSAMARVSVFSEMLTPGQNRSSSSSFVLLDDGGEDLDEAWRQVHRAAAPAERPRPRVDLERAESDHGADSTGTARLDGRVLLDGTTLLDGIALLDGKNTCLAQV